MSAPTDSFEMDDLVSKTTPVAADTLLLKDSAAANELKETPFGNLLATILTDGEIVTLTGAQTLEDKTLTTPIIADFTLATHDHSNDAGGGVILSTAALSDTGDIAYLNTANIFIAGNLNSFGHDATNAGLRLVPFAGNPTVQNDGEQWYNLTTNQILGRINGENVDLGANIASLTFIIDGGGAELATGVHGDLEIPFNCTIERVTLLADQIGDVEIDLFVDTLVNYPPDVADSIVAAAFPTITTDDNSQDVTLPGWTTALAAGSTIRYNVDSVTTITRVTVALLVRKTA